VVVSLLRRVPDGAGNDPLRTLDVKDNALLDRLLHRIETEGAWLGGTETIDALRRLMGRTPAALLPEPVIA